MIRVFIIAPTPIAQAGLHTILSSEQIQVIGMSAVPDAFREEASGIDVLMVADEMQLDDVARSLADNENIALIVLTDNDERILPRLRRFTLPGWGIVPLDASPDQLRAAVMVVSQNMITLPTRASTKLYENQDKQVADEETLEEPLTPREQEVLELVSQGLSNKLIARRLTISEHTVKFHLSSLSAKLGASSRTDAVRKGLRRGLISV